MIVLQPSQLSEIFASAREADPNECCGLVGGSVDGNAKSIYSLRNVAADRTVSYRRRPRISSPLNGKCASAGEQLLGIYHSHPRSAEPSPSETDVRLAFYPQAVYFIVGLAGTEPVMGAFRISERDEALGTG